MNNEEMKQGLKNLQTTSMRLDITRGNKFNIINDCYNANPESMKAAIEVLRNVNSNRRVAVLGTMGEQGKVAFESHRTVGQCAGENGVDLLLTLGEFSSAYEEGFKGSLTNKSTEDISKGEFKAFDDYDKAVEYLLNEYLKTGDTVLVKASRSARFETIVDKLKKNNG